MTNTIDVLPDGWSVRISKSKRKLFYYHAATKTTQWTKPEINKDETKKDTSLDFHQKDRGKKRSMDDENALVNYGEAITELNASSSMAFKKLQLDDNWQQKERKCSVDERNEAEARRLGAIKRSMRVGGTKPRSLSHGRRINISCTTRIGHNKDDDNNCVTSLSQREMEDSKKERFHRGANAGAGDQELFQPWNHQIEAVQRVIEHIKQYKRSQDSSEMMDNYLLQHSTGSGKSITISCLVHQLLYAVDQDGRKFRSILLVVDRIKLEEQLANVTGPFLKRNGLNGVHRASSVEELAELLAETSTSKSKAMEKMELAAFPGLNKATSPQKVILTTIQKLALLVDDPVLMAKVWKKQRIYLKENKINKENTEYKNNDRQEEDYSEYQRVAVISDEAHRSNGMNARGSIADILANLGTLKKDVTYIGFTATPSEESLRLFGSLVALPNKTQKDSSRRPFHSYTMQEAVANGHILNVLKHYKSIRFTMETSIPPDIQERLLNGGYFCRVAEQASSHHNIVLNKVNYIIDHFQRFKSLRKEAKGMLIVRSREEVVKYFRALYSMVSKESRSWNIYASFSSVVHRKCDGKASGASDGYTERTLNGKGITLDNADLIIACDKLDTGYNEPRLEAMYIDRSVRQAKTVQLLSRLNRIKSGKNEVSIIDFVNHPYQIAWDYALYWKERILNPEPEIDSIALLGLHVTSKMVLEIYPDVREAAKDTICKQVLASNRDVLKQFMWSLTSYCQFCVQTKLQSIELTYTDAKEAKDAFDAYWKIPSTPDLDALCVDALERMDVRMTEMSTIFRGVVCPESIQEMIHEHKDILFVPWQLSTEDAIHQKEDLRKGAENLFETCVQELFDKINTISSLDLFSLVHRLQALLQFYNLPRLLVTKHASTLQAILSDPPTDEMMAKAQAIVDKILKKE